MGCFNRKNSKEKFLIVFDHYLKAHRCLVVLMKRNMVNVVTEVDPKTNAGKIIGYPNWHPKAK